MYYVVFSIDHQDFAIELPIVERVVGAVNPTYVPDMPSYTSGVVNIQDEVIPVINLRALLKLEEREIEPYDQFLVCTYNKKKYVIWVDAVKGVEAFSEKSLTNAKDIFPEIEFIEHVIKNDYRMIMVIHLKNLEQLEATKV